MHAKRFWGVQKGEMSKSCVGGRLHGGGGSIPAGRNFVGKGGRLWQPSYVREDRESKTVRWLHAGLEWCMEDSGDEGLRGSRCFPHSV